MLFPPQTPTFSLAKRTLRMVVGALLVVGMMVSLSACASEKPTTSPAGTATTSTADSEEALPNKVNPSQLPDSSFIYDASIASLDSADSYMNGQTVQVTGEVVGDRILADDNDDYCWITLQANDSSYAEVSVYMPIRSSETIDQYGSYGKHGTDLQVRGTFHLACKDHQGLSDLHAQNVTAVNPGYTMQPDVSLMNALPGGALVLIGLGLFFLYHRLKERER